MRIQNIAEELKPFSVEIGSEMMFGENGDIPVNIIKDQTVLQRLHDELNKLITPNGEVFERRWTQENYNAHITKHQDGIDVKPGEIVTVDHIYLVKMLDDNQCQFFKKYTFGGVV